MPDDWQPLKYESEELNRLQRMSTSGRGCGALSPEESFRYFLKVATLQNERNYGINWTSQENRDNA